MAADIPSFCRTWPLPILALPLTTGQVDDPNASMTTFFAFPSSWNASVIWIGSLKLLTKALATFCWGVVLSGSAVLPYRATLDTHVPGFDSAAPLSELPHPRGALEAHVDSQEVFVEPFRSRHAVASSSPYGLTAVCDGHKVGSAMPYLGDRVEIAQGDITRLNVDGIVNAANTSLLGRGGVDGAIHRAAGPELLAECKALGGARTGEAKITNGYRLSARYVIHAVGPVWSGGARREPELLASCYQESLELAHGHDLRSIAFPSISTGAYRFPIDKAAEIAQLTVRDWLEANRLPERVVFCCFSDGDREVYERVAKQALRD